MDEIIFKLFYNTDCCKKVVNFYKINKFYDESTFGGESIFSLNTILLHICKLLDSDEIYKKHLNIILDEKFTTKENDKLPFSINTLKKYKVENIMLSKKTIKENYNVVFGGLSSQRVGRILIIMSSDRIHDDFKRMLITYIYIQLEN